MRTQKRLKANEYIEIWIEKEKKRYIVETLTKRKLVTKLISEKGY